MNDLFQNLGEQLKGTSAGTKLVAALVTVGVIALVSVGSIVASRPDFQPLMTGLEDNELSQVAEALEGAGIPFRLGSARAPYMVLVEPDRHTEALWAAYGKGGLKKPLGGIITDSGISILASSDERHQAMRKREWQEMEGMLEMLDFVAEAHVFTSPGERTPFGQEAPITASVTLKLFQDGFIDEQRSRTVASVVSNGLGVRPEHVMLVDQNGRSLFDGAGDTAKEGVTASELLGIKRANDEHLAEKANQLLVATLGPGKARVTVDSEWVFEQTTNTREEPLKGAVVSETTTQREEPVQQIGGAAGVTSNSPGDNSFGTESAPVGRGTPAPVIATSSDTKKEYAPARNTTTTVRSTPTMKRMSVAVMFDESIAAEKLPGLENTIKAAVGFDPTRNDDFQSSSLAFHVPEVDEEAAAAAAAALPEKPSPLLGMLMERGVEAVTAVFFILLLVRSLKKGRSAKEQQAEEQAKAEAEAEGGEAEPEVEIDPEVLARRQVEELLESDPEKVGEILSSWAREETSVGA